MEGKQCHVVKEKRVRKVRRGGSDVNPEIIEWYKTKGYHFSDFFDFKRHGGTILSEAQIKAGGISYYNKVKTSEIKPKRINIGWGIIKEARTARFDEFIKDNEILERYKPIIEGLNAEIKGFNKRLLKYQILFWVSFGCVFCLFFKLVEVLGGIPL